MSEQYRCSSCHKTFKKWNFCYSHLSDTHPGLFHPPIRPEDFRIRDRKTQHEILGRSNAKQHPKVLRKALAPIDAKEVKSFIMAQWSSGSLSGNLSKKVKQLKDGNAHVGGHVEDDYDINDWTEDEDNDSEIGDGVENHAHNDDVYDWDQSEYNDCELGGGDAEVVADDDVYDWPDEDLPNDLEPLEPTSSHIADGNDRDDWDEVTLETQNGIVSRQCEDEVQDVDEHHVCSPVEASSSSHGFAPWRQKGTTPWRRLPSEPVVNSKASGKREDENVQKQMTAPAPVSGIQHVRILWDIENVPVPSKCDAYSVTACLTRFLEGYGYGGTGVNVLVTVFGRCDEYVKERLDKAGVLICYTGKKVEEADRRIIDSIDRDLATHPPNLTAFVLVTSDQDFRYKLRDLKSKGYHTVVVHQAQEASLHATVLSEHATHSFAWSDIANLVRQSSKRRPAPETAKLGSVPRKQKF